MRVPDERYSRNAPCAPYFISTGTIQGFDAQYFLHRDKKNRQKSFNLDSHRHSK